MNEDADEQLCPDLMLYAYYKCLSFLMECHVSYLKENICFYKNLCLSKLSNHVP